MTRWPVTVSYYDRDAKRTEGEQTPVYAMSFELYENGVSRSLVLDYNDFVIAGALGKCARCAHPRCLACVTKDLAATNGPHGGVRPDATQTCRMCAQRGDESDA